MGVAPQPDEDLASPLNDLEAKEDSLEYGEDMLMNISKVIIKHFLKCFLIGFLQPKSFDFVVKNRIKQRS